MVGGALALVAGDAEHPFGAVVVRAERLLPNVEVAPLRVAVEGGAWAGTVERVGVAETAAAHPAARHDEDVPEQRHPEDALQAEPRHPVVATQVPCGPCEVLVLVAAAALEHADRVALLAQAQ